jgi:Arc/MetJ family transcription regulator
MMRVKTTLHLDEDLVRRALAETGAKSKTDVLEMGLRALLERDARRRLKAFYGVGPKLKPVKRRRS